MRSRKGADDGNGVSGVFFAFPRVLDFSVAVLSCPERRKAVIVVVGSRGVPARAPNNAGLFSWFLAGCSKTWDGRMGMGDMAADG